MTDERSETDADVPTVSNLQASNQVRISILKIQLCIIIAHQKYRQPTNNTQHTYYAFSIAMTV